MKKIGGLEGRKIGYIRRASHADNSLPSYHPTFLSSKLASTQPSSKGRSKAAFTLAEVLITLGIIGVVAALTLPTLMAKYKKQVTANRFKKAYAEIAQAIQMSEAEYGMVDTWDWNQPGESDIEKVNYLLENYIIKRLKTTKTCSKSEYANCGVVERYKELKGTNCPLGYGVTGLYTITASGYGIMIHPGGYGENAAVYKPHIHMIIDTDGPLKGENKLGKDAFVISLYMSGFPKPTLAAYSGISDPDLIKNNTQYGCNNDAGGYFCGNLIMQNGWEIPDDYPIKF